MPGATTRRSRWARRGSSRRRCVFPETQGVVGYNDIDPRFGVAYDLFGNGKTAIKVNVGRYLEAAVAGNGNYSALLPISRITTTASRTWTDRNGNFFPDCDLQNPLAQTTTTDFCGQISDLNFGKTVNTLSYDPQYHARLVQPAERLDRRRDVPARDPAARLGVGRLHAALAPALHRHRQPGPERGRLHAVQHHGAVRSAAAGRRRLRGVRPVQRRAAGGQPGRQLPHVFNRHLAGLQRHRSQRHGADERPPDAGRSQHRAARHRLLRRAGAVARAGGNVLDRQRSAGVQPDEPLLPLRARIRHQVHDRRHLYVPEDRRAVERHADQQPRHPAARGLDA